MRDLEFLTGHVTFKLVIIFLVTENASNGLSMGLVYIALVRCESHMDSCIKIR